MPEFRDFLYDLALDMAAAADSDALFATTGRALADLGCDDFTFVVSSSLRLGPDALEMGVQPYHTTLSEELLRATIGHENFGDSIYVRRFLKDGLESVFSDPNIYLDASPAELAHLAHLQGAGYRRGFWGVLSRVPGHFTGICCHLDSLSDSELDRHEAEICANLRSIGQLMDAAFFAKHIIGYYGLSPRERDVLSWLAAGLRPDHIADRLGVGAGTVDKYIVNAKEKLSARTRDHAVARALMLGLINP